MYTSKDIFVAYKESQSKNLSKGYRMPKDWDYYWAEKLNKTSKKQIQLLTDYFNTIWNSLDLEMYMDCGFEILKSFSFKHFTDSRIIQKYIQKDKQIKRSAQTSKRSLVDSIKYVKGKIKTDSIDKLLKEYSKDENEILSDYISNKVSVVFLVFLNKYGYVNFSDYFLSNVPYFLSNYNQITRDLRKLKYFCEKILRS